jgi:VIT1/CCC1 family predicted Fe2+/Mn2+ transporter
MAGGNHRWFSPNDQSVARLIFRDVIIGFADGLTVPFALTAGLSSLGSSRLVVIGGLAELLSGAISMGMGAYLAALTDRERYLSQEKSVREDMVCGQESQSSNITGLLGDYGVSNEVSECVVNCLTAENTLIKVSL